MMAQPESPDLEVNTSALPYPYPYDRDLDRDRSINADGDSDAGRCPIPLIWRKRVCQLYPLYTLYLTFAYQFTRTTLAVAFSVPDADAGDDTLMAAAGAAGERASREVTVTVTSFLVLVWTGVGVCVAAAAAYLVVMAACLRMGALGRRIGGEMKIAVAWGDARPTLVDRALVMKVFLIPREKN
ncbi:hypothetical protein HGRIS_009333 [Hohenbuehelia grisea]|uniref:Uncharacterized protein n=1 Tax=Hohenbuehelia grisea TaxID=104357 RepID=A0ABR3J277_9AGAR